MKKALYILIAMFFVAIPSCKKMHRQTAIVIHDCMGQYLRFDNKDHCICNTKTLSNIPTRTIIDVILVDAGNCKCDDRNDIHCMTMHDFPVADGLFIVKRIEK